jgi:hypothetical protein
MLVFTDGPRLYQLDAISDLADVLLVMRFQLRHTSQYFMIERMSHKASHGDDDRFFHLVANHIAEPMASLFRSRIHDPRPLLAISFWFKTVLTRAKSRRVWRIFIGFSIRPVAS